MYKVCVSNALVGQLDMHLKRQGSPERAEHEKRYLKSELGFYGVSVPAMRQLARALHKDHPDLDHDQVWRLVQGLWRAPVHERRAVAIMLLRAYSHVLTAADLPKLEALLRECKTWALVDDLAVHVLGELVTRFPRLKRSLDRLSRDPDFWLRRAAMLALMLPLRRGEGDFQRFGQYADAMLEEREFFIRKAIGWVLREASKKRPDEVASWLGPRARRASSVTLREAMKYLPEDQVRIISQAVQVAPLRSRK